VAPEASHREWAVEQWSIDSSESAAPLVVASTCLALQPPSHALETRPTEKARLLLLPLQPLWLLVSLLLLLLLLMPMLVRAVWLL
jgi:hypothetical protein